MKKDKSLQEVMNELARPSPPRRVERARPPAGMMTEDESFCVLDPVAADLYKSCQDAVARFQALARAHGEDDPLVEVAVDMADSALSALETRILELRADPVFCRDARRMRVKAQRQAEREREVRSVIFRARLQLFYFQQMEFLHEKDLQLRHDKRIMMFLFWLAMTMLQRMQERMRLTYDFARACTPERNRATSS